MMDDLSALRLQLEWGADEAIGDSVLDRFAPAPPVPARRLVPVAAAAPAAAAPQAQTLDQLIEEWSSFQGCTLRTTAMQFVRPDGNPAAPLLILGDAPGSDDDRSGQAFSGATGQLVDRVLGTAGFDRRSTLLATLVPWRPPGNRRLSESEVQSCLPFVHRLLSIVRPQCIALLGGQAVRALTGEELPVRRLRRRWLSVHVQSEQLTIAALALPTPEQWLTNAVTKQQLWSDMVTLRTAVTTP